MKIKILSIYDIECSLCKSHEWVIIVKGTTQKVRH